MLHIIACVKVVTDPEAPASTFKIDTETRRVLPGQGVPPVLNPYDENALEAALRIKEAQEAKITVISAGAAVPKAVIKKCLAVGADDLIVIEDGVFEDADSAATTAILAAAIRKLGAYDMVLTGRMAADTNAGQVGAGLAEMLGVSGVTVARKIDVADGKVRIERALTDGYDVVEVSLPCVITVSHELGELRQANIKGLMAAQKQPFTTWQTADLDVNAADGNRTRITRLYIPERDTVCEFAEGETPEEAGANLALTLQQNELI
ncbi:MAG: electron transfer flavoprotein subunit beta/FixA family protein [Dehalococcoidales bacterium]|nr:electron transfer flavoprotein subunit beta/FixA family protein [Dehalococcoidales bacterium]